MCHNAVLAISIDPAYLMKTCCLYIPRQETDEATAIIATTWMITNVTVFERLLQDLHDGLEQRFALEVFCSNQTIYLCFSAEGAAADILTGSFYSMFGDGEVREIADFTAESYDNARIATTEISLVKERRPGFQNR